MASSQPTPFSTLSSKAPQEPGTSTKDFSEPSTNASPQSATEQHTMPKAIDTTSANAAAAATRSAGPPSASSSSSSSSSATAPWTPRPKAGDRNMSWSEQDMKHKFQERLTVPKDEQGFSSAAEEEKS